MVLPNLRLYSSPGCRSITTGRGSFHADRAAGSRGGAVTAHGPAAENPHRVRPIATARSPDVARLPQPPGLRTVLPPVPPVAGLDRAAADRAVRLLGPAVLARHPRRAPAQG